MQINTKYKEKIVSPITQLLYENSDCLEVIIINQFLETICKDFSIELADILDDEEKIVKSIKENKQIGKKTLYGIRICFSSLLASSFIQKDYNKSINFYLCILSYFKDLTAVEVNCYEKIENVKYETKEEKNTTLVKSKLTSYLTNLNQKDEGINIISSIMNAFLNEINLVIPGVANKFCEVEDALILHLKTDEKSKSYIEQSLFNEQIQTVCHLYVSKDINAALKMYNEILELLSSYYRTEIDATIFTKQKKSVIKNY